MRELISHQDITILGHYKSLLEVEGIASFIRNEHGQTLGYGIAGMFQRLGCLEPVLCVVDDERFDEAVSILQPHHHPSNVNKRDWQCSQCKEMVPGSFETCWNCQAPGPQP